MPPRDLEELRAGSALTDEGCWIWTGKTDRNGYAFVTWRGRTHVAHRMSYTLAFGEISLGMEIDHLCRVRACINPDHLEAVTHAENVRRSKAGEVNGARMRSRTHCARGHEYTPGSYRIYRGWRRCLSCQTEHSAEARERRNAS